MSDDPTQDLSSNETLKHLVVLIQGMGAQLSALQTKVDERLYDTRPLWESVQGQISDLRFDIEQGFRESRAETEQRFSELHAETEQGFRELRTDMERGFQEVRVESKADTEQLRGELTRELRHVSNSLDALHGKMLRYDTIQHDIENRVRDIESKAL